MDSIVYAMVVVVVVVVVVGVFFHLRYIDSNPSCIPRWGKQRIGDTSL
jgi:hypothetical protein